MALNLAKITDIFEDVGEYVERFHTFRNMAMGASSKFPSGASDPVPDLPADLAEIQAQLAANGRYDLMDGLETLYNGYKDSVIEMARAMGGEVEKRLVHRTTVINECALDLEASLDDCLVRIFEAMNSVPARIKPCAATVPSTGTAVTGINGSGSLLATKVLDGVTPPWQGGRSYPHYNGDSSELVCTSETITFECIADSETDGAAEGAETWAWIGGVSDADLFGWRGEGSGTGFTFQTSNGSGMISNGEFETFTSNLPDGWSLLGSSAAGTHVFQESTTIKRGSYGLKLSQSGALTQIGIQQTLGFAPTPKKRYMIAAWVKGEAGTLAGSLEIRFAGSGYTKSAGEYIEVTAGVLAGASWALYKAYINMPADVPSDLKLVIDWGNGATPTAAKSLYIDGLVMDEVNYHGGLGVNVVAGASSGVAGSGKFLRGDKFTLAVSNDNAGIGQTWLRRWFKVQAPSNSVPEVADTVFND